jgi:hypothetical protein
VALREFLKATNEEPASSRLRRLHKKAANFEEDLGKYPEYLLFLEETKSPEESSEFQWVWVMTMGLLACDLARRSDLKEKMNHQIVSLNDRTSTEAQLWFSIWAAYLDIRLLNYSNHEERMTKLGRLCEHNTTLTRWIEFINKKAATGRLRGSVKDISAQENWRETFEEYQRLSWTGGVLEAIHQGHLASLMWHKLNSQRAPKQVLGCVEARLIKLGLYSWYKELRES